MSMATTVLKAEQYSVVNIKWKWDTDGDEELFDSLPEEIVLPLQFASAAEGEDYLDDISEWISDKYGYLHNGFSVRKEHIAYVVFSEMQKQWINELLQMNDAEVYQKYDLERKKALSFTISFDDNMKAQMRFDSDFSEIILFDKDLEVCRGKCQKGTWKANYNDVVYVVEDNNMTAKKAKNIMDLCFIQHVLWALNDAGKAAVVVPAGFLSIKDGIEEKIRRRIVNNGWLSGVIIMPRNTFANTATKVAVLFIDKSKWHQQAVLMDASGLGTLTKIGKNKRIILSEDDAASIVEGFFDKESSSTVITPLSEIALNGYSFIPGQYMKMKNYQNLLSEEEFRDKTLRFEEDYKILCQKEKESDSTIFSILAQVRSNIC